MPQGRRSVQQSQLSQAWSIATVSAIERTRVWSDWSGSVASAMTASGRMYQLVKPTIQVDRGDCLEVQF